MVLCHLADALDNDLTTLFSNVQKLAVETPGMPVRLVAARMLYEVGVRSYVQSGVRRTAVSDVPRSTLVVLRWLNKIN